MNPVAVTQPSSAHAGTPVQDWDLLYRAVLHRLNLAAGQAMDSTPKKYVAIAADRLPNVILDCVYDLEQLHQALLHERTNLGRLDGSECSAAVKTS